MLTREKYWQWAHSDLLSNAERGVVAEYLVGSATGSLGEQRTEWDAWDLTTPEGIRIEVKSSGYVQSWKQEKPSTIRFSVREARGWIAATNTYNKDLERNADVYVFCIHKEKDRTIADPLQTDQWDFIVLSAEVLNRQLGQQKSVGLSTLLRIGGKVIEFSSLAEGIRSAAPNE